MNLHILYTDNAQNLYNKHSILKNKFYTILILIKINLLDKILQYQQIGYLEFYLTKHNSC